MKKIYDRHLFKSNSLPISESSHSTLLLDCYCYIYYSLSSKIRSFKFYRK